MKLRSKIASCLPFAIALSSLTSVLTADERPFGFSYEATTAAKGSIEYEQWVTWKARRGDPGAKNEWQFRHELEFGITDRFQLGLYLSNWKIINEMGSTRGLWDSVAVEAIYNLSNPTTDWIGSAIYGEVTVGDRKVELEGKLILQKNIGRWKIAYNAILEAEWEGSGLRDDKGEFGQTFGVSYELSPSWSVGAELLHEVEFDHWGPAGDNVVYLGPNVSHRFKRGYVTAAVLMQATGIHDEPDVQSRLIFGFRF
jgi:hypothetical protein